MSRTAAVLLLSAAALLSVGCHSKTSGLMIAKGFPSADAAQNQYKAALQNVCADKHRDQLSQEQLGKETHGWYMTLDSPARDQYDKAVKASCAANSAQPDCYNTGILQGAAQDGTMNKFAVQVCGPLQP